jgi:hypothetical protein
VLYYSPSKDRTYVVDEKSGKVVNTMQARPAAPVVVVEPAPKAEPAPEAEAPKAEPAPEPVAEVEVAEPAAEGRDGCEVEIEE